MIAHRLGARRRGAAPYRPAVLLALALLLTPRSAPAQPADDDVSPGLVIDEADVPVDGLGQPQLESVPGVRARRTLPAELEHRLLELSGQRTAIGARSAEGAAPSPEEPVPSADAPPRRDAGGRDPDRLSIPPPLPRDR